MKKALLFTALILIATIQTWASNAFPFPISFQQKDGTSITVRMHGNANNHYMCTLDGMLVVRKSDGIYVATINENNELVATNVLAHNVGMRSNEEISLAKSQNINVFLQESKKKAASAKALVVDRQNSRLFPHNGTPRVLVLLTDFTDTKFSVGDPVKNFDQYLNAKGHGPGTMKKYENEKGKTFNEDCLYTSVAGFFKEMSHGKFEPIFDVCDNIIHLDHPVSYYGEGGGTSGDHMNLFVPDVCKYASEKLNVDFSKYDSDNDGYCELIYIIYAGMGENMGGPDETIWAKSSISNTGPYGGKYIYRFGVSSELGANLESINGIGPFCHEFSHTMGVPDFYYTYTDDAIDNQGMEVWSIMDYGMYLFTRTGTTRVFGSLPVPYTAWERADMGWMELTPVTKDGHYTLYSLFDERGSALKITNPKNPDEYFVLENRQSKEWESGLLGHGLMVTHINYDATAFFISNNSVNNVEKHPRMAVVPADGNIGSSYGYDSFSDMAKAARNDLFPGTDNVTELSRESNLPNFDWFTSKVGEGISVTSKTYPNYLRIYNIKEEDGKIEFDLTLDTTTDISNITNSTSSNGTESVEYNVYGQKVSSNYRGVIIRNGKKFTK